MIKTRRQDIAFCPRDTLKDLVEVDWVQLIEGLKKCF